MKVSIRKKVRGLLSLDKPDHAMCKECQLGKKNKSSFSSKSHSSNEILDLVHNGLCDHQKLKTFMVIDTSFYLLKIIQE